ncbi:sensor histidine kinase [Sessilibacter corallicola]|uniref:histidine kinase n=1 Tax=Sessilibacter corallicola TaxID=2904075 RepID=A0ABQ0A9M7_9GAMM
MIRTVYWFLIFVVFLGVYHIVYSNLTGNTFWITTGALLLAVSFLAFYFEKKPYRQQIRALSSMVASWRDNEFGISIHKPKAQELAELTNELNSVGDLLRRERQTLIQRELLLQTVIQNSPMAVLLCDHNDHIILANVAASQWFNEGGNLNGVSLTDVIQKLPEQLHAAVQELGDSICTIEGDFTESYHVSRSQFILNSQHHHLILIRQITRELNRQEVFVWKKIIRIMSHEINNSMAPVSSLSHTGRTLAERGNYEALKKVFDTIEERAHHLNDFIRGYARFAKLPNPEKKLTEIEPFLNSICQALECNYQLNSTSTAVEFDPGQIEQALINLVKNALEAGSEISDVSIHWQMQKNTWQLEVRDRGEGIQEGIINQALLPFYSTKRTGNGLGLALAREILEAHGGKIVLNKREGGGTCVVLSFPKRAVENVSL